ncbi:MAG: hypothetical protein LBT40_14865 [Deltaproteobacteria bacterium]|jgi:hypothetical protein|nr:hypothetical protein [Deltaproteobacteria bacterium]
MARTPVKLAAIVLMSANSGLFIALIALSERFDPLESYQAANSAVLDKVTAIAAGAGLGGSLSLRPGRR